LLFIDSIKQKLKSTLPGKSSHLKLAPFAARLDYQIPEDVYQAAVLILLYYNDDKLCFPLITRQSHHPEDKHRGQIALPGGRKDLEDEDTHITSLRECSEEIGVVREQIELLGALSPLYIPVSYHHVFPYVGYYHGELNFNLQESEIHSIHEINVDDLLQNENRLSQELKTTEGPIRQVPTIQIGELTIWGATAMILEEFSDVMRKA
jgi:8-oxo-dGTP pyrophosphatase MutT (NUDIX family)